MLTRLKSRVGSGLRKNQSLEGGRFWWIGKIQFDYLLKEGLKPHHYLLDLPCGSFRAGRLLIPYLDRGHYFGLDASAQNIEAGRKQVLQPERLELRDPKIGVVSLSEHPIDFVGMTGQRFDYIWVHALYDHVPHAVIERSMVDLSNALVDRGRLYATIFLNPFGDSFREPLIHPFNGSLKEAVATYPDREYWHHTLTFFENVVAKIPHLSYEECDYDYRHPLGLRMLKFRRK